MCSEMWHGGVIVKKEGKGYGLCIGDEESRWRRRGRDVVRAVMWRRHRGDIVEKGEGRGRCGLKESW